MNDGKEKRKVQIQDVIVKRDIESVLITVDDDRKPDITALCRNGGIGYINKNYATRAVYASGIPTISMLNKYKDGNVPIRLTSIGLDPYEVADGEDSSRILTFKNSWPKFGSAVNFIPKRGKYFEMLENDIACFWTKNVTDKQRDDQRDAYLELQAALANDHPHLQRRFAMVALHEFSEWNKLHDSPSERHEIEYFDTLRKSLREFIDKNQDVKKIHLWIQGDASFRATFNGKRLKMGMDQAELASFFDREAKHAIEQKYSLTNPIEEFIKPFLGVEQIIDGDTLLESNYHLLHVIHAIAVDDYTQPDVNDNTEWWNFKTLTITHELYRLYTVKKSSFSGVTVKMMEKFMNEYDIVQAYHKEAEPLYSLDVQEYIGLAFAAAYMKSDLDNSLTLINMSSKSADILIKGGLKIGAVLIADEHTHKYNMHQRSKMRYHHQPVAEDVRKGNVLDLNLWANRQKPPIRKIDNFYDALELGPIILSPSGTGKTTFTQFMDKDSTFKSNRFEFELRDASWFDSHVNIGKTPSLALFEIQLLDKSRSRKEYDLIELAFSTSAVLRSMFISSKDLLLRFNVNDKTFGNKTEKEELGVLEAIEPSTSIVAKLASTNYDLNLLDEIEKSISSVLIKRRYTSVHVSPNVILEPITIGSMITNYDGDWAYVFQIDVGFTLVPISRSNTRRNGTDDLLSIIKDIEMFTMKIPHLSRGRHGHAVPDNYLIFIAKYKNPVEGHAGLTAMAFRIMFRFGRTAKDYAKHSQLETFPASGHALAALLMPRCILLAYLSEILFSKVTSPFSFPTNEPVREGRFHTKDEYLAAIKFAQNAHSLNGYTGSYLNARLTLFKNI